MYVQPQALLNILGPKGTSYFAPQFRLIQLFSKNFSAFVNPGPLESSFYGSPVYNLPENLHIQDSSDCWVIFW